LTLTFVEWKDGNMPRQRRKISKTKVYHVMIRGNEKKNIFLDDEDRTKFLEIL